MVCKKCGEPNAETMTFQGHVRTRLCLDCENALDREMRMWSEWRQFVLTNREFQYVRLTAIGGRTDCSVRYKAAAQAVVEAEDALTPKVMAWLEATDGRQPITSVVSERPRIL
jgi:hypothetical protein